MPAIGITGGVSTGKSTFGQCLREILPAAKFFDADQAAHDLVDLEKVKQGRQKGQTLSRSKTRPRLSVEFWRAER